MSLSIVPAEPHERVAAFELAFAHQEEVACARSVAQMLDLIEVGEFDARGIFIAKEGGHIRGVFLCAPMAGGSSLVWPPRGEALHELVDVGLQWLRSRGLKLAQTLVDLNEADALAPLAAHGFVPVGPMQFLQHDLANLPAAVALPGLKLASLTDVPESTFAATLERSYEGTFDFAELNDVRTIDDALNSYRANPLVRPEHGRLALFSNEPAGVLLLAEVESLETWELTYLGVVPTMRRRGLGRALVQAALDIAAEAMAARLNVAVDARNLPALQLYESLGFQLVNQRLVSLVFLGPKKEIGRSS